jgi:23S rRNA (cytidine1920-2'-O)/16S rRNA (cytidine1409-2'-O)-methyltransferase
VIAVDVGHGQLAWALRTDPRVTVMDRTNVRDLRPEDLPVRPSLVTADLSFIALRSVMRTLVGIAEPLADFVVLIKPQFEAERADVERGGVVRDPRIWRSAIDGVIAATRHAGAAPVDVAASTLPGPAGNVEFFLHAMLGGDEAARDVGTAIDAAMRDAETLAR